MKASTTSLPINRPKIFATCLSESCSYRVASAVATKNEGESHILDVNEIFSVSPGKHTKQFISKNDLIRKRRAMRAKLPQTKRRRNLLSKFKESCRKQKEKVEGIQYQSNCGMADGNRAINPEDLKSALDIVIIPEECSVVFFALQIFCKLQLNGVKKHLMFKFAQQNQLITMHLKLQVLKISMVTYICMVINSPLALSRKG